MSFANTLRHLIEERGLTQKKLANDLGIPVSTMGGYVQGVSEPDFETLKLIASYFEVSADYLISLNAKGINSQLENELLRIFRSLNDEQKELYLEQGRAILKFNQKAKEKLSNSYNTENSAC